MFPATKKYNKTRLVLALLLAFSILLGACNSPAPAPTPTPTLVPTIVPEPTAVPEPLLETISQAELLGETWQWVGLRETMPASQSLIADSENYTLNFNEDGTVNIKADSRLRGGWRQISNVLSGR